MNLTEAGFPKAQGGTDLGSDVLNCRSASPLRLTPSVCNFELSVQIPFYECSLTLNKLQIHC